VKRTPAATAYMEKLGEAVRMLRNEKGLSQEKLAERAELHPTYVGAVERGERNLTVVSLHRIASALGVNPSVLALRAEVLRRTTGREKR
jgi:transcriptional regulator with XRE-family HTH domain